MCFPCLLRLQSPYKGLGRAPTLSALHRVKSLHLRRIERWACRWQSIRSAMLKDRLGDQIGGEWMGADENSSRRSNSAYAPNSQPRIFTRVCQSRVVRTDLPTLGTNPKQSQSESATQEAKDLATLRGTMRTMCGSRTGGRSLLCVMSDWQRCVDWFLSK
jgi:hypothetical protein